MIKLHQFNKSYFWKHINYSYICACISQLMSICYSCRQFLYMQHELLLCSFWGTSGIAASDLLSGWLRCLLTAFTDCLRSSRRRLGIIDDFDLSVRSPVLLSNDLSWARSLASYQRFCWTRLLSSSRGGWTYDFHIPESLDALLEALLNFPVDFESTDILFGVRSFAILLLFKLDADFFWAHLKICSCIHSMLFLNHHLN